MFVLVLRAIELPFAQQGTFGAVWRPVYLIHRQLYLSAIRYFIIYPLVFYSRVVEAVYSLTYPRVWFTCLPNMAVLLK